MNYHKLFLFFPLIFASCATGYHSTNWLNEGFSEFRTADDSFVVTFKSNEYTTMEKTLEYALRRASELTLQYGYQYFTIITTNDTSTYVKQKVEQTTVQKGEGRTYPGALFTIDGVKKTWNSKEQSPGLMIAIRCYQNRPNTDKECIDAKCFLTYNQA